ncbi:hypothetical protein HID58_036145, partial [Brassica napus]
VKQQVLAFIRCLHGNLEGYDSKDFTPKQMCLYMCLCFHSSYCLCFTSSACPILIDDFVERPGLETNIELSFSTHFTIETQRLSSLPHRIKKCSRLKENKNLKTMKKSIRTRYSYSPPNLKRIGSDKSPRCSFMSHCGIEFSHKEYDEYARVETAPHPQQKGLATISRVSKAKKDIKPKI